MYGWVYNSFAMCQEARKHAIHPTINVGDCLVYKYRNSTLGAPARVPSKEQKAYSGDIKFFALRQYISSWVRERLLERQ